MKKALILFTLASLFLCLMAQAPDWDWATRGGGASGDFGQAISTDITGNSYATGYFSGTATIGATTFSSSGGSDIYVTKQDADGNWLWAVKAGGMGDDRGYGITHDASGCCYLTGLIGGTATFGSITLTGYGSSDIFVAKLNAAGSWEWAVRAGGSSVDIGRSIALDSSDNIYITGSFRDAATFGATILTSSGGYDVFVAKLSSSGSWLWAISGGAASSDRGYALALDPDGYLYCTGYYLGTAVFGTTTLISSGAEDIYVAKVDPGGSWLWAVQAGGPGLDSGRSIAVDSSGNSYVTGDINGTAVFGTLSLTSNGSSDAFVAKLDSSGNWEWVVNAGGTGVDIGYGIVLDNNRNSLLTGSFEGTATFGGDSVTSNGGADLFIAKINTNGTWTWVAQAGGSGSDISYAISLNSDMNCHITGSFEATATIGAATLTSSGGADIVVAKLNNITETFEVIVGTGNSNQRLPVYVYGSYSYSQSIFYPAELDWPTNYRIEKIYYYYNGFAESPNSRQYVIYMGHTASSVFSSTTSWIPLANLTEVYRHEAIPQAATGGYWMEFALETPFIYNGVDNLVIAVDENQPGSDSSSSYYHSTLTPGVYRSLRYHDDIVNPDPAAPPAGTRMAAHPNIKFFVDAIPAAPELSVIPPDWDFGSVVYNTLHTKQFLIQNTGCSTLTISGISITDATPFTLSDLPALPLSLTTNQTASFTANYDPIAVGANTAEITITHNRATTTVPLSGASVDPTISTLPHSEYFDGVDAPTLPLGWTGYVNSSSASAVIDTYYSATFAQSHPNSVRLFNHNDGSADLRLITPWIAVHMSRINLSFYARCGAGSYPLLVGTVSAPDGSGVFTQLSSIALNSTKTEYVVSLAGYAGTDRYICFKHGLGGTFRSIYVDNVILESQVVSDLAATAINGTSLGLVGSQMSFEVTVYNAGTVTADAYNVHLKRSGGAYLSTLNVTAPLGPELYATHTLTWMPSLVESFNLVAEVEVLAGDNNSSNDVTDPIALHIYPASTLIRQIGNPASTTTSSNIPFSLYHRNSLSETIFLSHELDLSSGTIQGITLKNTFTQDLVKPAEIWVKQTTQENLAADWLDFSGYTLVFSGNVHYPTGVNSVYIDFDTPFPYTGGNLAVRFHRVWESAVWNLSNQFYYTASAAYPSRTRYIWADGATGFDPASPPGLGTLNSNIPNTGLVVDPWVPLSLDTPVVTISRIGTDVQLDWPVVANALSYDIYASDDPYTWPDVPTATVTVNFYTTAAGDKGFFKVVAVSQRNMELLDTAPVGADKQPNTARD